VAGNTPDVKVFEAALPKLISRLEALGLEPASITVVFDKGNNSGDNLAAVADREVGFVGSLVPTQHADLLAVTDDVFHPVEGLDGVTAYRCEKEIAGTTRTIVVTRSQTFLAKQLVGLAQTRGRVEVQLSELVRLLSGHRHKMDAAKLAARVDEALSPRWMARLYRTQITGATREDLALAWSFDEAFAELKDRELGKRIIFTDRAEWSTSQIVVAYR
jgi:transposase